MMRIAVPMSGDHLEEHFGHCESFAFLDVDPLKKEITATTVVKAPEHQPGLLPPWLKERGVTVVIAGGMGTRARSLCEELSIQVIAGAPAESPASLARRYLENTLATNDHVCSHH